MTEPADGSSGAQISQVETASPAAAAGLGVDDVVVALDGERVSGVTDLMGRMQGHRSGDQVTITVFRNGARLTLRATLGTRTES